MKKKIKKLMVVLCSVALFSSIGIVACAYEQERLEITEYEELTGENVAHGINDVSGNPNVRAAMLMDCTAAITVSPAGVKASFTTGSTVDASEIGIEDVKIQMWDDDLAEWVDVATHPGGYNTNTDYYAANFETTSAYRMMEYRACCTHYAILNGERHELQNATMGLVCR